MGHSTHSALLPHQVKERGTAGTNSSNVSVTRVINEVIVADEQMPQLLESLWWLAPDAVKLEAHRYILVLDVACDDVSLAPGYCQRRLRKAALDLGITLATGDVEVVGEPTLA